MTSYPVVELLGDGISAELSTSVHTLVDALPFDLEFHPIDLSRESRLENPSAALPALANMLRHLGETETSRALRGALMGAIADGAKTRDIGGDLSTTEFTTEVAARTTAAL